LLHWRKNRRDEDFGVITFLRRHMARMATENQAAMLAGSA
jgi:hypothetical protein